MQLRRLPVYSGDFEFESFPEKTATLPYKRQFTHDEYRKLKLGHIPHHAGDFDYAYFDRDHVYIFHGSFNQIPKFWYDVTLVPNADGAEVADVQIDIARSKKPKTMSQTLSTSIYSILQISRENPLTPSSWKIIPMPEQHTVHQVDEVFTEQQFYHLMWGELPLQMEDKWFVYGEGKTLYYHRSWTGYCVFQIEFVQEGNAYRAIRIMTNDEFPDFKVASALSMMQLAVKYQSYRYECIPD